MQTLNTESDNKLLFRGVLIWLLAAFFYFYDNLLQISPTAMMPELTLSFAKQAEEFGSLSAYCLYAYGIMQIPAGILLDRFGPRRIITVACLLCGLGSLIFGMASVLWEAKFARVLIGIGASFAFVSCIKIISIWFPKRRFAFMIGLTALVGFLGSVFGLRTISHFVLSFGWRESMQWGGIFGLGFALLLWGVIRDKNPSSDLSASSSANQNGSKTTSIDSIHEIGRGLKEVLSHSQTWVAAIYAGLMFVPTLTFGGLWGVPFLVQAHGFDRGLAGDAISLIYIGWLFGAPFWGYVSDYLGKRNGVMFLGGIITLGVSCSLIYIDPLSDFGLKSLLWSLGFFSSVFILAFAVVQESNPPQFSGTAIGFTNTINTFFGAMFQPVVGKILDVTAKGEYLENGQKIFNLQEYQLALAVIPLSVLAALIILCFLKEKPIVNRN